MIYKKPKFVLNRNFNLFLIIILTSFFSSVIFLATIYNNKISFKENTTFIITTPIKDFNESANCLSTDEKIICENWLFKIENKVPEIIDEENTKGLMNWFVQGVNYGPEILLLDKVVLSNERCGEGNKELTCNGATNFYDSKKSIITLFPYIIIKGQNFLSEPLKRRVDFSDLTYYLAHEYYHHVTQMLFYDIASPNDSDDMKIPSDAAGNNLNPNEGSFGNRYNKSAVMNFINTTNATSLRKYIDGMESFNCTKKFNTDFNFYFWSNKFVQDNCTVTWKFPPFQADSENLFYPKNAPIIKPSTLNNCGYFANIELNNDYIKYYLSIDELLVRQFLLMTYIEGSSNQIGKKIPCFKSNVIDESVKKVGEINGFLFDYYLLSKLGFLPFSRNIYNGNWENATDEEKNEQEKINNEYVDKLLKYYFQVDKNLSIFMYNPFKREYSIGGYLDYDLSLNNFIIKDTTWEVESILVLDENDKILKTLKIHKRHNFNYVNHYNAINPLTRNIDETNEIVNFQKKQGYVTDWFLPPQGRYKLYFLAKSGINLKKFPINNGPLIENNKTIRINHGEDSKIRKHKLVFNSKEETYYAFFE